MIHFAQDRTQLADTPGSKYTQDCLSLISEARFGELLSRWLSQIELLLAKAQDKGVPYLLITAVIAQSEQNHRSDGHWIHSNPVPLQAGYRLIHS